MTKLPILVERTIADTHAMRVQLGERHSREVHDVTTAQHAATMCSKGCSNCCHHPFFISVTEGILLYRHLAKRGLWTPTLQKQIRGHRDKTLGTAFNVWLMANIPCPLLDENKLCVGYEARPLNCRTTYAFSDPKFCHPHEIGPRTNQLARADVVQEFNRKEQELLHRHNLKGLLLPVSQAVLIGESVSTGKIKLEASESALVVEFAKVSYG